MKIVDEIAYPYIDLILVSTPPSHTPALTYLCEDIHREFRSIDKSVEHELRERICT